MTLSIEVDVKKKFYKISNLYKNIFVQKTQFSMLESGCKMGIIREIDVINIYIMMTPRTKFRTTSLFHELLYVSYSL